MELILIRHGRPERVEGAQDGADPALTEAGHAQAAAVADWLKIEQIDALYVSPMARARQTSAPLEAALGLEAAVVDGVREFDAEEAEYIPMDELRQDKEAWRAFLAEHVDADREAFQAEVLASLAEITSAHRGQRVAVTCHGGVINAYAADVLGIESSMFFNPDYTSINRFMVASSGERSVQSLNDIGHLRSAPELILR